MFTHVIWKKTAPSRYRRTLRQELEETSRTYTLEVHHETLGGFAEAKGSQANLVLIAESAHRTRRNRSSRCQSVYRIQSCEEIRKERILAEEIGVFRLRAELVTHSGKPDLPAELGPVLTVVIKPGLSLTLSGNKEIYMPFAASGVEVDF